MSELTDFWKSCGVWWAQISSLKPCLDGSSFLNYIWVSILITWRLRCKQNCMRHAIRASTVVHIGQKTQGNALWKKKIRIRMGLVFSKDCWVFRKTIGNLLWNYTEVMWEKHQTVADSDRIKVIKYVWETQNTKGLQRPHVKLVLSE